MEEITTPARKTGRRPVAGALLLVPLLLLAAGSAPAQGSRGAYAETSVTGGATLTGRVVFSGDVPEPTELLVTRDFEVCGLGVRERREVDVGQDRGLRHVVVFIAGIDRGKPWPEAPEGYVLDQADCYFEPYIQVVPRGAELRIANSDPILHNVHGYELNEGRRRRTLFNLAQSGEGVVTRPLRLRRGRRIGLECDAHDFMLGWIFAADSPYAAVVDSEGRFSIPRIPPGTYTVRAWHPFLGFVEHEVSLAGGAEEQIELEFRAD